MEAPTTARGKKKRSSGSSKGSSEKKSSSVSSRSNSAKLVVDVADLPPRLPQQQHPLLWNWRFQRAFFWGVVEVPVEVGEGSPLPVAAVGITILMVEPIFHRGGKSSMSLHAQVKGQQGQAQASRSVGGGPRDRGLPRVLPAPHTSRFHPLLPP